MTGQRADPDPDCPLTSGFNIRIPSMALEIPWLSLLARLSACPLFFQQTLRYSLYLPPPYQNFLVKAGTDWRFRLQPLAFVGSGRAPGLHPGEQGSLPAAAAASKINMVEELVHTCPRGHTQAPAAVGKSQKHAALQTARSPTWSMVMNAVQLRTARVDVRDTTEGKQQASEKQTERFHSTYLACPKRHTQRLCDPMDCSTPGLPVLHHLPELAQTHVHRVGDLTISWSTSPPRWRMVTLEPRILGAPPCDHITNQSEDSHRPRSPHPNFKNFSP